MHVPAAERRRQIIDAATRVISREGVSKATTRRICDEARANIGTLHYTFSGKDDLFEAVFAYCWDVVSEIVDEAVAASSGQPHDTAREIITRYVELAIADPHLVSAQFQLLTWSMAREDASEGAALSYAHQHDVLLSALRQGNATAVSGCDEAGMARMITALIDGMCLRFTATGSADELRRDRDTAVAMIEKSFSVALDR